MQPRLKKAEATAGMKNTFFEFSIPITSAVTDTIVMKGYMMRTSCVHSSRLAGFSQPELDFAP